MATEAEQGEPDALARAEAAIGRVRAILAAPGPIDDAARADVLAALDEVAGALALALEARGHHDPQVGLRSLIVAAETLEQRHPTLVGLAQRISDALAQIGI